MKDIRQLDKLLSPLFHCLFMASFMFMITIIVTIMKKENKFSLSANIIFTITKDNIGACLYSGPPRFPFVFFTQFCHFDVFAAEKFCSWQNQAFEIIFLSGMFFSTFQFISCVYVLKRGCSLFQIQRSQSCVAEVTSHQLTLETAWESDSLGVVAAAASFDRNKKTWCNHNPFPYHLGHYPFHIVITLVFSERSHQYLQHKSPP